MKKNNDLFADIAASYDDSGRGGLINPEPPALSDHVLALSTPNVDDIFTLPKQIDTKEELYTQLAELKTAYAPYMQNLAPTLTDDKKTTEITTFDWRLATQEDLADPARVTRGEGSFETVTIPHYGGPMGVATSFYRQVFTLDHKNPSKCYFATFKAVDYKAQIFINGNFAGSHEGFFAPFEFDITNLVKQGENILVVQVENDYVCQGNKDIDGNMLSGDKIYAATGMGWDDAQFGWQIGRASCRERV